jgi:hypothetical protein
VSLGDGTALGPRRATDPRSTPLGVPSTANSLPWYLSFLARAYAKIGQFDDAWRCIDEAMTAVETTKEKWCEADIRRFAGEIALMSLEPDATKAETYFEHALIVAREQQAKSLGVARRNEHGAALA